MSRFFISYGGNSMALPEGESFVGRGLSCRMRFNDPAMSRKHLSLTVRDGVVVVKDLGSRNGSELNGEVLSGSVRVLHGDLIQIGTRTLKILEDEDDEESITLVPLVPPRVQKQHPRQTTTEIRTQRCPECATEVNTYDDSCKTCGYTWGDFRPQAATKAAHVDLKTLATGERRQAPRHKVQVPVVYTSESLSIESHALDLSRSGIFIRTQLLEPVGTTCSITMLVDGTPALTIDGKVCRVVDEKTAEQGLGLGIQFLSMGDTERSWLETALARAKAEKS